MQILLYIAIGVAIGWITAGIGFYLFLEWQNKKMFLDKPYKRKGKWMDDRIVKGFEDEFRNFKK